MLRLYLPGPLTTRPNHAYTAALQEEACCVKSRSFPFIAVGVVGVTLLAVALWARLVGPGGSDQVSAPSTVTAPVSQVVPKTPAKPADDAGKSAPLPPLVPGNPLTDDRFSDISARLVIASVGLKKQQDWQNLVIDFLEKELAKEKLTEEQFSEYAEALYDNPDRARAVGENIVRRVEKKLGVRMDMKTLPLYGLDPKEVERLKAKLSK